MWFWHYSYRLSDTWVSFKCMLHLFVKRNYLFTRARKTKVWCSEEDTHLVGWKCFIELTLTFSPPLASSVALRCCGYPKTLTYIVPLSCHRLNLLTFNSLMGYCAEKCKQRLLKWKYQKNSKRGCVQLGRDETQFTMCFYIVTLVATSISSWPSVCRQRLALIVSIPHKDQENSWATSTLACPIWFQWGIMKMLPENVTTNGNFFVLPLRCLLLVWEIKLLALNC